MPRDDVSLNKPSSASGDRPVQRSLLRRGVKFDIELVERAGRDGVMLTREVIRHPGSVIILPLVRMAGGETGVVLIENFRLSTESVLLELPAGTRTRGEDPALCAGRELIEETGYAAGELTLVTTFLTAPGLTDEEMAFFVARDLRLVGQDLENDEEISVRVMSVSAALGLIATGDIRDAKTMLALLLAKDRGILPIDGR